MLDVSIVIPCYNAEQYIDECIGSAMEQVGITFEIIAIDDASRDGTWDCLQELAEKHPALRIEKLKKNIGQAGVRNLAIDQACGRYIALLDSDDSYRSHDVLKRWVAAADADSLELCIAQHSVLLANGTIKDGPPVPPTGRPVGSAVTEPSLANATKSWQILFRRSFLDEHNIRFSNRLRQREDRLFFTEAFLHADRVGVTQIDAILYRIHPSSTMRIRDIDQLSQLTLHIEILEKSMTEARAAGRVSPDFERVSGFAYWNQIVRYWDRLLVSILDTWQEQGYGAAASDEVVCLKAFLAMTHKMTKHCGPLFLDRFRIPLLNEEAWKYEGVLDIARLAVAAGRWDVLHRLLKRERIHHSVLRELIGPAGFDWGEAAVLRYICFGREAKFAEEPDDAATPPLHSLVNRVILHVGMPKTGSSAIQETLENNRFKLLEHGVWFPLFGSNRETGVRRDRRPGQLSLFRKLIAGSASAENARRRLAAEIAALETPVDTLVLSVETFLSHVLLPPEGLGGAEDPLRKIVEGLGLDKVTVVALFRRQDRWFHSYYKEITANPFNSFVGAPQTFFNEAHGLGLFDYDRTIAHFQTSELVSELHFDDFDRIRARGGSVRWFFDLLGLGDLGLDTTDEIVANESLSDAVAANVRLLKVKSLSRHEKMVLFRKILDRPELQDSPFSLLSEFDRLEIKRHLRPELAAFDRRFPDSFRSGEEAAPRDDLPLSVIPDLARLEPRHVWLGLRRDETPSSRPLHEVVGEFDYMVASRSWALTGPLRKALVLWRRVRVTARRRQHRRRKN